MPSLTEVPTSNILAYADLFSGPHAAMVVASIAEGNTASQLWQIEHDTDVTLLLWDKGNNVFYLAGSPPEEASVRVLTALFTAEIQPQAQAAGRAYFKTRALTPQLEDALPALFAGIALREAPTLFYSLPHDATPPAEAVAGIRFAPIDRALFASDLHNLGPVNDEIGSMWPSLERFYERGFGWAALDGPRMVCWCTAEYVNSERCGIGIATDPSYQRRGIATATAARFCRMARERGVAPHWECGSWNGASIRVAEKVGFARAAEERYWIGSFDA